MLDRYFNELAVNDRQTQTDYQWTVLAAVCTFRNVYRAEMMEKMHRTAFNEQMFLITDGYESMLHQLYGDYMTLPPAEERVCKHQPARIAF